MTTSTLVAGSLATAPPATAWDNVEVGPPVWAVEDFVIAAVAQTGVAVHKCSYTSDDTACFGGHLDLDVYMHNDWRTLSSTDSPTALAGPQSNWRWNTMAECLNNNMPGTPMDGSPVRYRSRFSQMGVKPALGFPTVFLQEREAAASFDTCINPIDRAR